MSEQPIERIRISEIHIENPRPRNRARRQMIVANIREVGLKKPAEITRTLTFRVREELTRSSSPASRTRKSFAC